MASIISVNPTEKYESWGQRVMNVSVRQAISLVFGLILCIVFAFYSVPSVSAADNDNDNDDESGIHMLKESSALNQIPLLNNRFRIDHNVDEVKLLFFREMGSPPVILVKPDGSKIYATQGVVGVVDWFDDATYDLIKITNPMPGPWQAVGKILPNSKIMIITDIELHVEDLPPILIQGETIKVTAKLTNGGEPIYEPGFRDIVNLNVTFSSTNNSEYDNFGADTVTGISFQDNGRGFDEKPRDGVFTGEFKLDFPSGEWIPRYFIEAPLFSREIEHDPVIVRPFPVKTRIDKTSDENGYHKLHIDIIGDYVDKSSMIFQGKVHYPTGDIQSFSVTEETEESRTFNIMNYDYGGYKVTLSAFGNNVNGREFMLEVPDTLFSVEPVFDELPENNMTAMEEEKRIPTVEELLADETVEEPEDSGKIITVIIVGNVVLLIIGIVAIKLLTKKPSVKKESGGFSSVISGLSEKVKSMMPWNKNKAEVIDLPAESETQNKGKNGQKSDSSDDILDLSMPDN